MKSLAHFLDKLQKKYKIKSEHAGIIASIAFTLTFCQVTINKENFSSGPTLQIASINLISLILIILVNKKTLENTNKIKIFTPIILLIILTYILSCINSQNFEKSIMRFIITFTPSVSILFLTYISDNIEDFFRGFSIGLSLVCTASVFYAFIGLLQSQNYISTTPNETLQLSIIGIDFTQTVAHRSFILDEKEFYIQRYSGILPNPNGLGLLSAITFGLSYNRKINIRIFIQTVSIIGLTLSLSRMGILLFLTSAIYLNIKSLGLRKIFSYFTITLIISFSVIASKFPELRSILQSTSAPSFLDHEAFSLGERGQLLAAAWNGFTENWWLGVGFGVGSEYLFPSDAETKAVHSVLMNSLVETGVFGTILLITIWILPIYVSNRTKLKSDNQPTLSQVIPGILLGLFVAEAFDLSVTRFHYIHLIFFTLLGIWFSQQQKSHSTDNDDAQSSKAPRMP